VVVAALAIPTSDGSLATATTTTMSRTLLSVTDPAGSAASVASAVRARGGVVVQEFALSDALLVDWPAGAVLPAGAVAIPDAPFHVASLPLTTASVAGATFRETLGTVRKANGTGVTVAVVDTGVADVPDLAGRVTHVNVSGGAQGDGLGHGTFLAGLIAGSGASSGGTYAGVAPGADILDVQVAAADGSTSLSKVLAGLQAVADARASDRSLRVLSLALSSGSPLPPTVDPLTRGLDRMWGKGVTVVVAAGNDGPDEGTVSSPGNDPVLITVGSIDEHGTPARADDTVADFSARGSLYGADKPDVVAPGVSLVATRAPGSVAETANPGSWVGNGYLKGTGTSMSEAVVAGAAAVLYDVRGSLTPDTVKSLLTSTAYSADGLPAADAGAGGVDLAAAAAAAPKAKIVKSSVKGVFKASDARYAPLESDAVAWAAFVQAWQDEDLAAAAAAWADLSPQTRKWAANAFAAALVMSGNAQTDEAYNDLVGVAHRWAEQGWSQRDWADDSWVAHRWADAGWAAHRWAFDDWAAHRWAEASWDAHRWAAETWAAHRWAGVSWDAHRWAAQTWDAHRWAVDAWDAHRWAAEDWLAFAWSAHRWAAASWASDAWVMRDWSAHRWATSQWDAHRWADSSWDAHRWATDTWSAHRWAATSFQDWSWAAHRWASDAWDAHRWAAVTWTLG
jgi:serine protease AprX